MKQTGIDIIIPVYNALNELKLCVESILRHTDLSKNRVLVIDDKSPDPGIATYLDTLTHPGFVVLRNEENQGFSGTINRGIGYSDRDVLLLNSDTIVTSGWVEKITACADSDAAIATVTPFSNNATLCSIPDFCQDNQVPYGLSIDEYAAIIEKCSLRRYPTITVAVGFCMFIKREVIDLVGLFDQETFRRGYGEENDFCWRAEQLGYRHVLCDDTYIYHSGTVSFLSEEKKKLIAEHEGIIQSRYPVQHQKNDEYVRDNPHQYLRTNVDLYARLANGKKNILYVLHMDFRTDANNNIGGTQFHVKDLTMHLRRDHNVFVLARDEDKLQLTVYTQEEQTSFSFYLGAKPAFQVFHDREIARILRMVLTGFSIDLVHVHHISDLSFDVFPIASELEIPLVLTLHDYYYICPTIKLLKKGERYCGGSGENCTDCLHCQLGYAQQVDYLPHWQEKCREALGLCSTLVAPSQAARDVYTAVYPELAERIRVIPHGMDPFAPQPWSFREEETPGFHYHIENHGEKDYCVSGWAYQQDVDCLGSEVVVRLEDSQGRQGEYRALAVNRPDLAEAKSNDQYLYCGFSAQIPDSWFASGKLKMQLVIQNGGQEYCSKIETVKNYVNRPKKRSRIAFLGGLNEAKGSRLAYEMIRQSGSKYDWYIIGGIGDPNLLTLDKGNVRKTGWYKRENVGRILTQNEIDLVCILSIWPETFCYTVSEAQIAGVPVLVSDIGALGERMRREQTGWMVAPDAGARETLDSIETILTDRERYEKGRENLATFRHKTIGAMCEEYAGLYAAIPNPRKRFPSQDPQGIYNAYVLCQSEYMGLGAGTDMDLIRRVRELEMTLSNINQSLEYRMVKFFNREKLPFKRQIKWLIGLAYRVYKRFSRR